MDAAELAIRALRHRDRSRKDLDERLERAGIPADERVRALDDLAAAGLLSDGRFAAERAHALARRGAGDELIRRDLRRQGVADELVEAAVADLEPETERAVRIFHGRGGGARALRYLAGKGFTEEALDGLVESGPLH